MKQNDSGDKTRGTRNEAKRHGDRETSRRRLLTALGIGGSAAFLPQGWQKPVVKSLVLPAHAQTSPPTEEFSFTDPCSVSLSFEAGPVGPPNVEITPTVGGLVIGDGDLGGIRIEFESRLTMNGVPLDPQFVVTGFTETDSQGNYLIVLNRNGTTGPHLIFDPDSCDDSYPDGVEVMASSPDPRLPGTATCTASFTCEDIDVFGNGSIQESGNRTSSNFFVELKPVDPFDPTA